MMPDAQAVRLTVTPEGALDLGRIVEDLDRLDAVQRARAGQPEISVAWLLSRSPLLGGEYYRGLRPAALLNHRYGWHTAVCNRMGTTDDDPDGPLSFVTPNDYVITPKVIVIRPIREWSLYWTKRAQRNGQLVIADLDDDLWAHEMFEPWKRADDDNYDEWCWSVDGWLVSTSRIRWRVNERGPKFWAKDERKPVISVAPNCYDPDGIGGGLLPRPGRTIGTRVWLGARMNEDMELWRDLFGPLLRDETLDLRFVHMGHQTEPFTVGPQKGRIPPNFVKNCHFPPARVVVRPSSVITEMWKSFTDVSVGAIVQADHPYNLAKTETSAFELAAMGLPLVAATNHVLYKKVPGRVELEASAVRERVEELLDPAVWQRESMIARTWARDLAIRREREYLNAFADLVKEIARTS